MIAILPLVVGAISVALLSVFKNEQPVANSLTSSGDAQVTSSTFVKDVQSANWITNNLLDICTGVPGAVPLLSLSTDDVLDSSKITNVISYVEVPNSGSSTFTIKRETCTGGTGSTFDSIRTVSHNALGSTSVSVIPASLDISKWVAGSGATSVTLNLNEPVRTGSSNTNSYTLTAVPRVTGTPGAPPSGFQPILPLELVGSACSPTSSGINITGNSSSVTIQDGKGGLGGFGISESASQCPNPVGGSGSQTFSAQTPYNYNVADPLANLTPPSFPSLAGLGAGSCTATTCTSGVYGSNTTGAYSNGNVSNVTFDASLGPNPGVVVFTVPVTVNNVTFDGYGAPVTGMTYWFQGGLTVAGHATATFGSATYIYGTNGGSGTVLQMGNHATIAVPVSSPGLLFYVPPGTADVSLGAGFSGTLAGALSPYLYLAIWDASKGTLSFGQGNGGASGFVGVGGIYDPNGTVTIGGQYSLQSTYFVVNSFSIQTSAVLATG